MITKRILGLGFASVGLLATLGLLALAFIRPSDFTGIGPAQLIGLIVSTAVLLLGLSLIPFGDDPA